MTVYTHDEAARIVELFEGVLEEYGISVPSPEDDEREPDNMVGLYGSVYYGLLAMVEDRLLDLLSPDDKPENIVPYVFSGRA